MFCEDKKCPVYIECMERLDTLPYCASKAAELATTANQQQEVKESYEKNFVMPHRTLVERLSDMYHTDCFAVMDCCNNVLDKSGTLLNEVREQHSKIYCPESLEIIGGNKMEKKWCMCKKIKEVARDGDSTCMTCGGKDAYGGSPDRGRKYRKNIDKLSNK